MKIFLAGCVILDDYGRILLLHRNTPLHIGNCLVAKLRPMKRLSRPLFAK